MKRSSVNLTAAAAVAAVAALTATLASASRATAPSHHGPLTLFAGGTSSIDSSPVGRIVAIGGGKPRTIWHCPRSVWCGEPVSFAWAPGGRRVALTLDELGGNSPYVGFHVLNTVSGQDKQISQDRVGCWPAVGLAWSPEGTRLAYICTARYPPYRQELEVLRLRGSGHTTVPTNSQPFWPSWSASGTRIAYSTQLTASSDSAIYTIALDGSHERLVASGGAAPAWSPNGRTIAYQTICGIRLVTPSGMDVTPRANANACGAIGLSGPPVWSPDGAKLAVETSAGIYVMEKSGGGLHRVSKQATTTWYGEEPGRASWRPAR